MKIDTDSKVWKSMFYVISSRQVEMELALYTRPSEREYPFPEMKVILTLAVYR